MFTALSMLLLHSFMPHQHHDELSEEEHIEQHTSASTAFDYLALLFHENIGVDHLEHFETTDYLFNFCLVAVETMDYYFLYQVESQAQDAKSPRILDKIVYSVLLETSNERGPPMV